MLNELDPDEIAKTLVKAVVHSNFRLNEIDGPIPAEIEDGLEHCAAIRKVHTVTRDNLRTLTGFHNRRASDFAELESPDTMTID